MKIPIVKNCGQVLKRGKNTFWGRQIKIEKLFIFQGELCLQSYASGEIAMGVVGGIAVVLSVVIILAYRNYRYEQELDSLLWKIDSAEIKVSIITVSSW